MNKKLNKNLIYIFTVLEAIEKIKIYTKEFSSSEEFFHANNQKEFNASLNLLIAIGEEVKKIDDSLKSPPFNWQSISDLRNILSHNYRGVDKDIIWNIIHNHLDTLKELCIQSFRLIKPDPDILKNILTPEYYRNIMYLTKI